ncbi:MAG TPA: ribonuclease H-like domain-containing protein [Blastocatellia bacterium]|nr:ribonuclease H-like domain-containing protein [Blastocatellia bacterium]HMX26908.1 ribonuclease H-like domain-containing protein [Blastocatellia bacterium]HMY70268.1 ribonuclease H-like domain-containing protein [Blastocatellia bacterium]HMZ17548.1 ribonuclease H-like domain-containing protein [Blastocatellia bacterium]
MRRIFLDIETVPADESQRAAIEHALLLENANKTKPLSEEALAEESDEQFRKLALQGEYGRILAIGLVMEENGQIKHQGILGRDRETRRFHLNEAQTLASFWRLMNTVDVRHDLFIGHNILDFDLPFIVKRSIILQVPPSIVLPFRRYQRQPIFDTMWEWNCWQKRIKLDELTKALNLASPKSEDMDGSMVYDAYLAGRHEDIATYCMRDVEAVREVYYRMTFRQAPAMRHYGLPAPENSALAMAT